MVDCALIIDHLLYWVSQAAMPLAVFLNLGSFSYTSCAAFISMQRVSLTHPVLASFLFGEFSLLHIPCCLHFMLWSVGSFSVLHITSRFIFMWRVSLTYLVLASFFDLGSFSYTSRASFSIRLGSFSLLHIPCSLYFSFSGEFLLHIPCWLLLLF